MTGKEIELGDQHVQHILNHPSMIKPRCHWNKKDGKRQRQKRKFLSVKEAEEYIIKRKLKDYDVYRCRVCNCYHIGHVKNKIKKIKL